MKRTEWRSLYLVVLMSSAIFLYAHWGALTRPFVINDDVRQQIYWMQRWQDPQLFENDWLSEYARRYVPWGVQGLYWMVSFLAGPISFSKWLPGLLFVLLGCVFYRIGKTLGNDLTAWVAAGMCWLDPFFLDNLSGGLARSFASPLLSLFLYFWIIKRPTGIGVTLFLQSLFIPYVFVLSVAAMSISWIVALARPGLKGRPLFPSKVSHFILLLFSVGVVFLFTHDFNTSGFGPLVSRQEMAGRPEFGPSGRYPELLSPSFVFALVVEPVGRIAPFQELGVAAGVAGCIALAGLALFGLRRVDRYRLGPHLGPFLYLALSSLLLYGLAQVFPLKLFVPSRYVEYPVHVFYCLAIALGVTGLMGGARHGKLSRDPRVANVLKIGALLFLMVLAGARLKGVGLWDYSEYKALYETLQRTPKHSLIAGHPYLMDNVPTFARRKAFAFFEICHPWSRGLWARLGPMVKELLGVYYGEDPAQLLAFCRKHDIDYFVVDDRHFNPEFLAGQPFFAPFDEEIRKIVSDRTHFAALSDLASCTQRVDGHIRLIRVRDSI